MRYVRLGGTGTEVSALGIGGMSFGDPARGTHPWTLDEERSRPLIRQALDLGINFFDTANVYSDGSGEEILGRALLEFAPREDVVIATKVYGRMRSGPNGLGLSRKAIRHEIDQSLRRLGTDHVDLYQIHRFDPSTPLEETLEALDDVVRAGKALYLGASSMYAWQFQKAVNLQERHGWARFVTMQSEYSLIVREDEREMFPYCQDAGVGAIPWSPLGRGRLARPWDSATERTRSDQIAARYYRQAEDSDHAVVDAVGAVADRHGVSRAEVALAWVSSRPVVSAPLVGVTRAEQLTAAVASLDLQLTDEEIAELEAPYTPRLPEQF